MSNPVKYPWTTEHQFEAFDKNGSILCVVDAGLVRGLEDVGNDVLAENERLSNRVNALEVEAQELKAKAQSWQTGNDQKQTIINYLREQLFLVKNPTSEP